MNATADVLKISPCQVGIVLLLAALVFSAGYSTSENTKGNEEQFDVFSYKVNQEVQPLMDKVMANPTEHNLRNANNKLIIEYESWGRRQDGKNKEIFMVYLAACETVIDTMQNGEQPDISEMNRLKNELI